MAQPTPGVCCRFLVANTKRITPITSQLTGFFSLLLWAGAVLCFVGYAIESAADNLYLGIVLVTVVMVTGIFSYLQNSKSENLMASFASMLPPKVKLLRNGVNDEVLSSKLVPGDIVMVEGGDLIPADLRILECSDNLVVDNSALTGEVSLSPPTSLLHSPPTL